LNCGGGINAFGVIEYGPWKVVKAHRADCEPGSERESCQPGTAGRLSLGRNAAPDAQPVLVKTGRIGVELELRVKAYLLHRKRDAIARCHTGDRRWAE